MSGVGAKRGKEDEDLVEVSYALSCRVAGDTKLYQAIKATNPNDQPLIIVDTRPKVMP